MVCELLRTREYVEFYIGRNGEFDVIAASVIKRAQKSIDTKNHFKEAITKRNKWLVDNTDMLIAFVENNKGGAYQCLEYAKKAQIDFINIAYWKNE